MICAGDPAAPNAVPQVALGLEAVIASPVQPAIGAPPFSNVIVPAMVPRELTVATSVTGWFVARLAAEATRLVLLGVELSIRVSGLDEAPSLRDV